MTPLQFAQKIDHIDGPFPSFTKFLIFSDYYRVFRSVKVILFSDLSRESTLSTNLKTAHGSMTWGGGSHTSHCPLFYLSLPFSSKSRACVHRHLIFSSLSLSSLTATTGGRRPTTSTAATSRARHGGQGPLTFVSSGR